MKKKRNKRKNKIKIIDEKNKKEVIKKKEQKKTDIFQGVHKTKVRVIGIGGGGGSIVSEIAARVKKADFIVANTDKKSLNSIKNKKVKYFQFGQEVTGGLGAGMNPKLGEEAAKKEEKRIEKLFEGQDLCILISSLGGGTGGGATPIFAKIARKKGSLVYGIFTFPFEFEGEKKIEIAKEALLKIKPYLNIYSVIPNERIFQIIDKNTPLQTALSIINQHLAENLKGLIEMIYLPGLINIDFADLKTILTESGKLTYLNTVRISDPKKEDIVKKLISSKIYPYTIQGARGIIYNIIGDKDIKLSDIALISKTLTNALNKKAKIIFGINQCSGKEKEITLTVLAVGCSSKGDFFKTLSLKKKNQKLKKKDQEENKNQDIKILIKEEKERSQKNTEKKQKEEKDKKELRKEKNKKQDNKKRDENNKNKKEKKKITSKPFIKQNKKIIKEKEKNRKKSRENKKAGIKIQSKKENKLTKKIKISKEKKEKDVLTKTYNGIEKNAEKIRRNALQVKEAIEEEERKLIEQEKLWEVPAIFRRKNK